MPNTPRSSSRNVLTLESNTSFEPLPSTNPVIGTARKSLSSKVACANAAELSLAAFKTKVRAGLDQAQTTARLVHLWHEPEIDFPIPSGAEPYLKIGLIQTKDA